MRRICVSLRSFAPIALAFGFVVLTVCVTATRADDAVNFQPACKAQPVQGDPRTFTASCEIGPIGSARVARVTYHRDGSAQAPAEATFLPFDLANRQAAILFVIDRSDRRRARTVTLAVGDAVRMSEAAHGNATYRFGIASTLGDRLDVAASIGSPHDDLVHAVSAIHADAVGTESSRAELDAIRLLAQSPADRHILVISTDGKPEDKALGSDELISAARSSGVVVIGIGYRERSGDGPELGSLKRFAEATGGYYVEPLLPSTRIDDAAVVRFAQFAGSGGLATFPLDRADPRGRYQISVESDGGKQLVGVYTPEITLPGLRAAEVKSAATSAADATRPALGPKPVANTPAQLIAPTPTVPPGPEPREPGSLSDILAGVASNASDVWSRHPLTIGGALALIILLIVGITGVMIGRARRIKVFAWIELLDQRRTRFPVTTPGVRLGRHSDNDIRFRDKSVHRYHAILSRDATTGAYQISDVSRNQTRSNGVMVNGELVHNPVVLANGDTIELGEVSFRFVYT